MFSVLVLKTDSYTLDIISYHKKVLYQHYVTCRTLKNRHIKKCLLESICDLRN